MVVRDSDVVSAILSMRTMRDYRQKYAACFRTYTGYGKYNFL